LLVTKWRTITHYHSDVVYWVFARISRLKAELKLAPRLSKL